MNGKIATAVLAASLSMAAALPAFAGQWEKNGTGWWYNYGDGTGNGLTPTRTERQSAIGLMGMAMWWSAPPRRTDTR